MRNDIGKVDELGILVGVLIDQKELFFFDFFTIGDINTIRNNKLNLIIFSNQREDTTEFNFAFSIFFNNRIFPFHFLSGFDHAFEILYSKLVHFGTDLSESGIFIIILAYHVIAYKIVFDSTWIDKKIFGIFIEHNDIRRQVIEDGFVEILLFHVLFFRQHPYHFLGSLQKQ